MSALGEAARTNPRMEIVRIKAAPGVLLEAPVYEQSKRGVNWLAVIGVDATKPGGLSRRFLPRGRGICLYQTEQLAAGDAVEFGADYISTTETRHRTRWYGVVFEIVEEIVVLEHYADAVNAISRSVEIQRERRERQERALAEQQERALAEQQERARKKRNRVSSKPVKTPHKPACPKPKSPPPTTSPTRSRSPSGRGSRTAGPSSRR